MAAAKVYMKIGDPAPISTADMEFVAVDKSSPYDAELGAGDMGKRVDYTVRWATALDTDGEDGPMSEISAPS